MNKMNIPLTISLIASSSHRAIVSVAIFQTTTNRSINNMRALHMDDMRNCEQETATTCRCFFLFVRSTHPSVMTTSSNISRQLSMNFRKNPIHVVLLYSQDLDLSHDVSFSVDTPLLRIAIHKSRFCFFR